jgi:hypothetical protein
VFAELFFKIKTGYIQTDECGVNTHYKSNKKQTMGTYAFNIYGWLIGMPTVPQRTIESKTNMQYIEHIFMYLVVEGISIPILMLCVSSL